MLMNLKVSYCSCLYTILPCLLWLCENVALDWFKLLADKFCVFTKLSAMLWLPIPRHGDQISCLHCFYSHTNVPVLKTEINAWIYCRLTILPVFVTFSYSRCEPLWQICITYKTVGLKSAWNKIGPFFTRQLKVKNKLSFLTVNWN